MSSYVKRVGDLTEPVELSASQVTEKMTSTVDTGFDPVTKPAHYAGHTGIECKQAMESMLGTDEYVSYMQGCAFKYLWRWKSKNGIEDLKKAHECAYCGETIPAGTRGVLMESGLWMRLFWKRYACPRCQPYVSEFWSWQGLESEDIEWDFDEFMREYHRDVWVTDDDD